MRHDRDGDLKDGDLTTVAGLFNDRVDAERAIESLNSLGIHPREISILTRDPETARDIAGETGAEATAGAIGGAGLGAFFGTATGLLVGMGALTLPVIGPVIAAGPLAAALGTMGASAAVGAASGAVTGGLLGALAGWGFSVEEAEAYEDAVKRGQILVAARVPDDMAERAENILREQGDQVSGPRRAA
jgi:hypothetical protein